MPEPSSHPQFVFPLHPDAPRRDQQAHVYARVKLLLVHLAWDDRVQAVGRSHGLLEDAARVAALADEAARACGFSDRRPMWSALLPRLDLTNPPTAPIELVRVVVSDRLWDAVHKRLRATNAVLAKSGVQVRRRRDIDSEYWLSGFARCATCGGTLSVLSRSHGKRRLYMYGCLAHAKRGKTICDNALVLPVERVDSAVLAKLTRDVL